MQPFENLPSSGESASDRLAFQRYLEDVKRGKSLMQLKAMDEAMTPEIRRAWAARSFTPVRTPEGVFDEVVCNASYHFHKHGQKYGTIQAMTTAAVQNFNTNRHSATKTQEGLLKTPDGSLYEPSGKIITFVG